MTETILVPVEPTIEMMQAGVNAWRATAPSQVYAEPLAEACYLAMLAAAPKPTIPADDREEVAKAIWDARHEIDGPYNETEDRRSQMLIPADAAIHTLISLGWKK